MLNSDELDKLRRDRRELLDEIRDLRKTKDSVAKDKLDLEAAVNRLKETRSKLNGKVRCVKLFSPKMWYSRKLNANLSK